MPGIGQAKLGLNAARFGGKLIMKASNGKKVLMIDEKGIKNHYKKHGKKDKKKKDKKFICHSYDGSNKLKTKLEAKITSSRKELTKVYNAVIRGNSRDQADIINKLKKEVRKGNTDTLNLWTSDIAGSHVQRCYNYKTLESWTATKDIVELHNLLGKIQKKHCTDFEDENEKVPPQIWEDFSSMWDKCSREFVKTSMENQKNLDKRTDINTNQGYLRNILTYNMMFTYPAEMADDLGVLLSYAKTFWKSELPEIIEHIRKSDEETYLRDYVKNLNVFASCNYGRALF